MDNWTSVYNTETLYQAELIQAVLEENGINAVILNQRDSSYTTFGEIHVMVNQGDLSAAQEIVNSVEIE